ncbi:MAG: type II toxin-antitoxin system RelB/DinJ family antitoxin [Anaerolineaceae bacterium]|nr:type II toxin-antitoxin system RelB/DinJ family antitoxin [Anaerolineaceae bacterium]
MPKTQTVSARVNPELKESVERIFGDLGLTSSQAITLFLRQVELLQGLPFSVRLPIPNQETIQAINEAKKRENLTEFANVDELFNDLGN